MHVFSFVCEHLGEAAGGEVGLFSVDSSDPPIFSGPLLGEQCPDEGKQISIKLGSPLVSLVLPALAKQPSTCPCYSSHLVLVEIGDDHTDKQSEPNHATQEHKNVDVDAMNLQTQR